MGFIRTEKKSFFYKVREEIKLSVTLQVIFHGTLELYMMDGEGERSLQHVCFKLEKTNLSLATGFFTYCGHYGHRHLLPPPPQPPV
jgi:hypothetical protein